MKHERKKEKKKKYIYRGMICIKLCEKKNNYCIINILGANYLINKQLVRRYVRCGYSRRGEDYCMQ